MISQSFRYVYVCEFGVKTVYSRFQPPNAYETLQRVMELNNQGVLNAFEAGQKKVTLTKIRFEGRIAKLLFRLTDPDIPDNILENEESGELREATRLEAEVPARSAHLVIDCSEEHDVARAYPATVENVDYLSKSYITLLLNKILRDHFTEERPKDDTGYLATYSPRIEFRGHQSQTISRVLQEGGSLEGLKFVTNKVVEDDFGDPAYAVLNSTEVTLDVRGAPSGEGAIAWIRDKYAQFAGPDLEQAKIVICDSSGRVKTSKLDTHLDDVMSNFFILQRLINDFEQPLVACENDIREDVVTKMISELPA